MKIIITFIVASLIMASCQSPHEQYLSYFKGNTWTLNGETIFRNDSIISPKNFDARLKKMVGDTAFPLLINDTLLIYKRIVETGDYDQGRSYTPKSDTLLIDTIKFDFKIIHKVPRLILYLPNFPIILTSGKTTLKLNETYHVKPVQFVMAGYSIGDNMDRGIIKTRGIYNYKEYTIEDCELLTNSDIEIKIIGFNTIYSIERHNIPDFKIQEITKIVTTKIGIQPEYSPMRRWDQNSDYEYEFYRWNKNYVRIMLSRSRYVGTTNYYKNLLDKGDWTLYYDDDIQKNLLIEKFKNKKNESEIIE